MGMNARMQGHRGHVAMSEGPDLILLVAVVYNNKGIVRVADTLTEEKGWIYSTDGGEASSFTFTMVLSDNEAEKARSNYRDALLAISELDFET